MLIFALKTIILANFWSVSKKKVAQSVNVMYCVRKKIGAVGKFYFGRLATLGENLSFTWTLVENAWIIEFLGTLPMHYLYSEEHFHLQQISPTPVDWLMFFIGLVFICQCAFQQLLTYDVFHALIWDVFPGSLWNRLTRWRTSAIAIGH